MYLTMEEGKQNSIKPHKRPPRTPICYSYHLLAAVQELGQAIVLILPQAQRKTQKGGDSNAAVFFFRLGLAPELAQLAVT